MSRFLWFSVYKTRFLLNRRLQTTQ